MKGAFELVPALQEDTLPEPPRGEPPPVSVAAPLSRVSVAPPGAMKRVGDSAALLAEMLKRKQASALPQAQPGPAQTPTEPGKFEAGKPGKPRSGMSARELLRDPVTLKTLMTEIASWEEAHPKRKLLGPVISSILPGVSDAQARTIARRINQRRDREPGASRDYEGDGEAALAALGIKGSTSNG